MMHKRMSGRWGKAVFRMICGALLCVEIGFLQTGPAEGAGLAPRGSRTGLFHVYDALTCSFCHTVHYSEGGTTPQNADIGGPFQKLLIKRSTTDLCLGCHAEPAAQLFGAPMVMTLNGTNPALASRAMPAGDFYYSNVNPANGHNPTWTNGHTSTVLATDPVLAPSFPPSPPGLDIVWTEPNWDCTTCHGAHNRFGAEITAWRQLRRTINGVVHTGSDTVALGVELDGGDQGATTVGYEPIASNSRGYIDGTSYYRKRADGQPLDGADLFAPEGPTNKNVYRGGFSSFCAVCHGAFHGGTETVMDSTSVATSSTGNTAGTTHWLRHPTNVALNGIRYNVAKYTVTVSNSQGTNPNPPGYDWKYPLRRVDGTWTATSPSTAGEVAPTDRVMCLTCHKAHASQYSNSLRWDNAGHAAFLANGELDGYYEASNGDNPAYGCNKCHQKGGASAFSKSF